MTESDWLTSTDPGAMLAQFVPPGGRSSGLGVELQSFPISDRKLRLLAVACCRSVFHLLTDDSRCLTCHGGGKDWQGYIKDPCRDCGGTGRVNRSRRAVEVAERYADGLATEQELRLARSDAHEVVNALAVGPDASISDGFYAAWVARWLTRDDFASHLSTLLADAESAGLPPAAQAALLREIVCNPWRPVAWEWCHAGARETLPGERYPPSKWWRPRWVQFGPPWESALALARSAYAERREDGALDPVTLAVLADALEEAGCTDEAILRHLRGWERCPECLYRVDGRRTVIHGCGGCGAAQWIPLRAPHVRGCWAVDALLGKG